MNPGAAGIFPADQSEESTAGKMPAAPWRCPLPNWRLRLLRCGDFHQHEAFDRQPGKASISFFAAAFNGG